MTFSTQAKKLANIRFIPGYFSKKIYRKWKYILNKNNPALNGPLHPDDGMFSGDIKHYIQVGQDAVRLMEGALQLANINWNDLNTILDIPSGFGRELRALVDKVAPYKITACDILQEQIDFCEQAFNCKKFLSDNDFLSIKFPEKYSLIWVGSLFTHLDRTRFEDLLGLLFNALEPKGILIFTTHGKYSLEVFESYWQNGTAPMTGVQAEKKVFENNGFYFYPYKYSSTFGISISLYDYVANLGNRIFGQEGKFINYGYKAWDNHQDTYAIQKLH